MKSIRILISVNIAVSIILILLLLSFTSTSRDSLKEVIDGVGNTTREIKSSIEESVSLAIDSVSVPVSVVEPEVTTAETNLLSLVYDQDGEYVREYSVQLPEYLLGRTREQCEAFFGTIYANYTESEGDGTILSAEVTAFSENEIVVKKFCDMADNSFYVTFYEGKLIVYRADQKTVFQKTEIRAADLSTEEQLRVGEGFYIYTQEEMFAYLESVTS